MQQKGIASRMRGGFTILEFLFTATIVFILASVIIVNRQSSSEGQALARSANLIAVDLRRVQTSALAAPTLGVTNLGGYGVVFSNASATYTSFQDLNGNLSYDPPMSGCQSECIEQRTIEGAVAVRDLLAGAAETLSEGNTSELTVIFCPPYGDVFIFDSATLPEDRGINCAGDKAVSRRYATISLASPGFSATSGILENIRIFASGGVDLLDDDQAATPPNITYSPSAVAVPPPPPSPPTSFTARINFQRSDSLLYPGYLPDYGCPFGGVDTDCAFNSRGGLSYGWTCTTSGTKATTIENNSSLSPDQRYDTFARIDDAGGCLGAVWELKVPSAGLYNVTLVAGDPSDSPEAPTSHYVLHVEGQAALDATWSAAQPWTSVTVPVNMTSADMKITVQGITTAVNNKINFIIVKKFN